MRHSCPLAQDSDQRRVGSVRIRADQSGSERIRAERGLGRHLERCLSRRASRLPGARFQRASLRSCVQMFFLNDFTRQTSCGYPTWANRALRKRERESMKFTHNASWLRTALHQQRHRNRPDPSAMSARPQLTWASARVLDQQRARASQRRH